MLNNQDMKYFTYLGNVVATYNKHYCEQILTDNFHDEIDPNLINEVTAYHAYGMFCGQLIVGDSMLDLHSSKKFFEDTRNEILVFC